MQEGGRNVVPREENTDWYPIPSSQTWKHMYTLHFIDQADSTYVFGNMYVYAYTYIHEATWKGRKGRGWDGLVGSRSSAPDGRMGSTDLYSNSHMSLVALMPLPYLLIIIIHKITFRNKIHHLKIGLRPLRGPQMAHAVNSVELRSFNYKTTINISSY